MHIDSFGFRIWDNGNNTYLDLTDFAIDAFGNLRYDWVICEDFDCVIEKCTGISDKNGISIYEGDIVRFFWYPDYNVYPVEWNNEPGRFLYCGYNQEINDRFHSGMGEVIGNIHEMNLEKAQRIGLKHKNEPDWNPAWMNETAKMKG